MLKGHEGYPFSGLIRLDALRKLPPRGGYVHSDRVLLLQLGLLGRFYEVPEYLSICTRHTGQASWTMPERNRVGGFRLTERWGTLPAPEWWDPARARKLALPEWNVAKEFTRSVARSPLSRGQRLRCYRAIARWALHYRGRFARDLVVAADQLLFNLQNRHATAVKPHFKSRLISIRAEAGNPYESRHSCRGARLLSYGGRRAQAKNDGRDWRQTNSLAHPDALRALRPRRVRDRAGP